MTKTHEATCQGYGCQSKLLIDAHIIPAGFGRLIKQTGPNIQVSPERIGRAKQQLGEFDPEILCGPCDNKLGWFDDYAIEVCDTFEKRHRRVLGDVFEVPNFDGDRFCKFVLSVLWRASISKRKPFEEIQLGPYEAIAREILYGVEPLSVIRGYEVFVHRYTSNKTDPTAFCFHPTRREMFGRQGYGFSVAGLRILAKISNQKAPADFQPYIANGKDTLRGMFVDLHETDEYAKILSLAKNHMRRTGKG